LPVSKLSLPSDFIAPEQFDCTNFFFTILEPSMTEIDYKVVMASKERLRHIFFENDIWPHDDMTLTDNTNDLIRHENEFYEKKAFAYSVYTENKNNYIGCVYINPTLKQNFDCEVYLWVGNDEIDQDELLYESTKKWLAKDWPFKNVAYPGREISWQDWQ